MMKHEPVCGSRTELCEKCKKYVLFRDKLAHDTSICATTNNDSSKNIFTKQELKNLIRPTSSLNIFPCEFCNEQFIGFQELIKHQVLCSNSFFFNLFNRLKRYFVNQVIQMTLSQVEFLIVFLIK